MTNPKNSRLFTKWTHPVSGVESFILTGRAAPVQQSFYYTHPSWSDDGRYLWLGCGYPPEGGRHSQQVLGVVDFEKDELRVYPETQFPTSRPFIDLATGEAYWGNHLDIWKRGPRAEDKAILVNSLPARLIQGKLAQLATHPTFSADGKSFNLDIRSVRDDGVVVSYLGDMPLDGSEFRLWQKVEGRFHNHALFSPTDPDLQMCAHDFWQDQIKLEPFNGEKLYHRIYTIRRGGEVTPFLKEPLSHSDHEWWDASGEHVWYLHYGVGVKKVEVATREEKLLWPGALSHAHSSQDGRYLVADRMDHPHNPDCHVLFRDTVTGREVEIVNRPPLPPKATQCVHLHPHPQFCLNDRYICYTTTVHGRVDIALVPTADLIDRTL